MVLKGLNKVSRPANLEEGQWVHGKNFVITNDGLSIKNEDGQSLASTHTNPIKGIIPIPNGYITFSTTIEANVADVFLKIESVIDGVQKTILNTQYSSFTSKSVISGVFKYNYKKEIIIYFWDGVETTSTRPCVLNINTLPFTNPLVVTGDPITDYELDPIDIANKEYELLRMFPYIGIPNMTINSISNGGGSIRIGSYYFLISYELDDANSTKWTLSYNPIPLVVVENEIIPDSEIPGTHVGTKQIGLINKSVSLHFDGLDTRYKRFKLAYVFKESSADVITNSKIVGKYNITGTTIDIIFDGSVDSDIADSELLIDNIYLEKIKTGSVLNEELILANCEEEEEINYQKFANNISVEWVTKGIDDTKDIDKVLLFDKSVMIDEVYALYIHPIYNSGRIGKGFHIPGRVVDENTEFCDDVRQSGYSTLCSVDGTNKITALCVAKTLTPSPLENLLDSIVVLGSNSAVEISGYTVKCVVTEQTIVSVDYYVISLDTPVELYPDNSIVAAPDIMFFTIIKINSTDGTTPHDTHTQSIVENGNIAFLSGNLDEQTLTGKMFHFRDNPTCIDGHMGYWENENEVYPDNENSEVWDVTSDSLEGVQVVDGITPRTYANQNVRHHKIPNFKNVMSSFGNDINSKITIGIKLTNVKFPTSILNKIQGYIISYAKRDFNNCTVLGSDILKNFYWYKLPSGQVGTDVDYVRINDIALLNGNKSITPSYIKGTHSVNIVDGDNIEYVPEVSRICLVDSTITYAPPDNSATTPDNFGRESCLILKIPITNGAYYSKGLVANYVQITDVGDNALAALNYGLIKQLKYDLYKPFDNQKLVFTNKINFVNGEAHDADYDWGVAELYGFDSFFGSYAYHCVSFEAPLYTSGNYAAAFHSKFFNPYFREARADYGQFATIKFELINVYDYNTALSVLNNIKSQSPYSKLEEYIYKFPYRLYKSDVQSNESKLDGWRIFRPNNYHESVKNKGEIWDIKAFNKYLIIRYLYATFLGEIQDSLKTNGGNTFLGTEDIFFDASGTKKTLTELIPVDEGYFGCKSQYANVLFPGGYLGVDIINGRIFIYYNGISEISAINKDWFEDILKFDYLNLIYDNPFFKLGVVGGYDSKYNRIILSLHWIECIEEYEGVPISYITGGEDGYLNITQGDGSYGDNGNIFYVPSEDAFYIIRISTVPETGEHVKGIFFINNIDSAYFVHKYKTISYSLTNKIWAFEHDYNPNYLFNNKDGLYEVKNDLTEGSESSKIYKFNDISTKGLYEGNTTPNESYIDLVFNNPKDILKVLNYITWNTDVVTSTGVKTRYKTITSIMVYNDNQCTGIIPVNEIAKWYNKDSGRNLSGEWFLDNIRDYVIDNELPILDTDLQPVNNNVNKNLKKWYDNSLFISTFVVLRLIYDNTPDGNNLYNDLYLTNVKVKFDKSER